MCKPMSRGGQCQRGEESSRLPAWCGAQAAPHRARASPDQDLSRQQESGRQPTEPPRGPRHGPSARRRLSCPRGLETCRGQTALGEPHTLWLCPSEVTLGESSWVSCRPCPPAAAECRSLAHWKANATPHTCEHGFQSSRPSPCCHTRVCLHHTPAAFAALSPRRLRGVGGRFPGNGSCPATSWHLFCVLVWSGLARGHP